MIQVWVFFFCVEKTWLATAVVRCGYLSTYISLPPPFLLVVNSLSHFLLFLSISPLVLYASFVHPMTYLPPSVFLSLSPSFSQSLYSASLALSNIWKNKLSGEIEISWKILFPSRVWWFDRACYSCVVFVVVYKNLTGLLFTRNELATYEYLLIRKGLGCSFDVLP